MSYILIRKEGFRTSNIMDKDTFYKNSIHQDITIHNEYASYNRTSKYMTQNLIELKRDAENSTTSLKHTHKHKCNI